VFYKNIVPKMHRSEIFNFKNTVTLKTGLGVRRDQWKCHNAVQRIWLPIDVL